ncbi:co-chaperone DjlA [Marinicella meishanensis]|uniref:co-chaperone DjlA n=1 Tax=Marinicella meishanensis TaxID=2873263 RepID=UPI001CBF09EE|nr:co-chaperone DjlA [Marinicella sp. NBU2979]
MGIIIGAIIGYKFGNIPGMLLGAWVGYWLERQLTGGPQVSDKKRIQEAFFNALFMTMGRLAKVDGRVSPVEIERTEGIMKHMNLNPEMRQKAIDLFTQGKRQGSDMEGMLRRFGAEAKRALSLKQIFLEMLVDVAEADGMISRAEMDLMMQVCQLIGYPPKLLEAMLKMRSFHAQGGYQQQRQSSSRQSRPSNRHAPFNPYQVLGVTANDNKITVRKAYKRLMSQHHPDKLVAKGLPPEMMKVAEEKAKQIQLSWEKVKELKGW